LVCVLSCAVSVQAFHRDGIDDSGQIDDAAKNAFRPIRLDMKQAIVGVAVMKCIDRRAISASFRDDVQIRVVFRP